MPEPEKGPETGGLYTTEIDNIVETTSAITLVALSLNKSILVFM